MAGSLGPCRRGGSSPLFMYMRSVRYCEGSKIEHLLGSGTIYHKRDRFDEFMALAKRLLRDAPMCASQFEYAVRKLKVRTGVQDRSLFSRGMDEFVAPCALIGEVRLINDEIVCFRNHEIASKRKTEFSKPKYKNMTMQHIEFLKSLFELTELTKQLSRGQK